MVATQSCGLVWEKKEHASEDTVTESAAVCAHPGYYSYSRTDNNNDDDDDGDDTAH